MESTRSAKKQCAFVTAQPDVDTMNTRATARPKSTPFVSDCRWRRTAPLCVYLAGQESFQNI